MRTSKYFFLFFSAFLIINSDVAFSQQKTMVWNFPLPRPHTGILIGNGSQGLMIWGGENQLNITIGHQGFWDHRDGNDIFSRVEFNELKSLLYAKDNAGLKKAFEIPVSKDATGFGRPKQIGGGRLEILFPEGYQLTKGILDLEKGDIRIWITHDNGKHDEIAVRQSIHDAFSWVCLPTGVTPSLKLIPSWDHVKGELMKAGVMAPVFWDHGKSHGFVQSLPEDKPLGIGYRMEGDHIFISSCIEDSPEKHLVKQLNRNDVSGEQEYTDLWWKKYWLSVPRIKLPDAVLQEIVDYGLYKQACTTPPHAKAAGLQGPFMEEYQLIPWSNDYHFNINVQMIYTPALASNRTEHFNPLWEMIRDWMPQLRENGERFFGRKGALILPHAVDDRGQVIGTFWAGSIDHGCTAWMAYLAWQHYRYTMDETILNETAWPLLTGAFEGFWAMLEEKIDGNGNKRLSLPVSVSPEYGGSRPDAWGRDASFQLAALHRIARILPKAAGILKKPVDPRWLDVQEHLPPYSTVEDVWMPENKSAGKRIALWENRDLEGSHRHHSHLAGLFPFCTIDPKSDLHKPVVANSVNNWIFKGAGNWVAWSFPWASAIWSRMENPETAVMWLHYWRENYVNEGHGTLFRAPLKGVSLISDQPLAERLSPNKEIMQLDAGMDALNAVFEMLVQNRESVITVLPAIHKDWKAFDFDGILTEGAFLVSAQVENGVTRQIRVKSTKGGALRLDHRLGNSYTANGQPLSDVIFVKDTKPGEVIILERK